MPMHSCNRCLENRWSFEKVESWITATCQSCGNEVTFEKKNSSLQELKEGAKCVCGKGSLTVRQSKFKANKLQKAFYYTAHYYCPACKRMFLSNDFKVINEDVCNANIEWSLKNAPNRSRLI